MERSSLLLRGSLDMCLLALLDERACYGYEIVARLTDRGLPLVAEGSVYPALSRLTKAGYIAGEWVASTDGPRRKYHRTTAEGGAALATWTQEWHEFRSAVDGIVLTHVKETP